MRTVYPGKAPATQARKFHQCFSLLCSFQEKPWENANIAPRLSGTSSLLTKTHPTPPPSLSFPLLLCLCDSYQLYPTAQKAYARHALSSFLLALAAAALFLP